MTQEYIDNGKRRQGDSCPIALAISEQVEEASFVSVGTCSAYYYDRALNNHFIKLPDEAKSFVTKFDKGELVEPFEFELVEDHSHYSY